MKTIGERIKELRESKNLSAKELCSFIGINTSTYFYNVSADYLLGTNEIQEDIVMYMKKDKNLNNNDIEEIKMIISMMDEAIMLRDMRERI